jgi:hypothetical protein
VVLGLREVLLSAAPLKRGPWLAELVVLGVGKVLLLAVPH